MKFNRKIAGVSLVGLLVGLGIGVLLIGAVILFVGRGFGVNREQFEQVRTTEEARVQLERMSDTIRNAQSIDLTGDGLATAPAEVWLQLAENNRIVFFGDVDKDPDLEKVEYILTDTSLIQKVTDPYNSVSVRETKVASSLRNIEKAVPLFTYYYRGSDIVAPTPVIGLGSVDRVGINLLVDVDQEQIPGAAEIKTVVAPREATGFSGIPKPECDDGIDNDGDDLADLNDPGCVDKFDNDEIDAAL